VLLDGISVGYAKDYTGRWDSLRIPSGRHAITFRSAGYTTVVVDLEAGPGARYVFSDDLLPGEGEVHRSLPGPAPASSANAATDVPRDASVSPAPSSPIVRGRLKVLAQPEDAAVYLDGEYLGLGGELSRLHGAIPVATGAHRLEIVRPGYASASETIEVTEADTANVQVTLVKGP
jgi:hypothetical protein